MISLNRFGHQSQHCLASDRTDEGE